MVVALDDDRRIIGRGEVEPPTGGIDPVFRVEDLGELGARPLLRHPSTHGFSSIVRRA